MNSSAAEKPEQDDDDDQSMEDLISKGLEEGERKRRREMDSSDDDSVEKPPSKRSPAVRPDIDGDPIRAANAPAGGSPNSNNNDGNIRNLNFSPADTQQARASGSQEMPSAVTSRQRKGKKASPGQTTARQKQKKKKQTAIKVGGRVWTKRKQLAPILTVEQKKALENHSDSHRCHGTVIKSKGKNAGYAIHFDELPSACKPVVCGRKRITACDKNEEEIPDPDPEVECSVEEETVKVGGQPKKSPPDKKSIKEFTSQNKDALKTIDKFVCNCGEKVEEAVEWTILGDAEHIKQDDWENPFNCPGEPQLKKDIDMEKEPMDKVFFRDFFPSVEGHAKSMDEFLSDPRADWCPTAKNEKIRFYDETADDPDWITKQCHLLLIAAVAEADIGVENLWRKGPAGGRHNCANFGQYIPMNVFECWQSAAALMFCKKECWCVDKRDKGWEMFQPCLDGFNEKRRALFECILLVSDESMAAWKPKTSKTGGTPNITSEPRKPCDLGAQFKNAVECISGCLVFQDIVGPPETQRLKGCFFNDDINGVPATSSLPNDSAIVAHVAEVKRQVRGADLKAGGWVGGDAWFGSVQSSVEVMREFGVHSTFVIKKNNQLFPNEASEAAMKARHNNKPQGHWVTMRAKTSGVQSVAIACAWSQKGIAHFISACGGTEPSPVKCEAKFEDDWGNASCRDVNRPNPLFLVHEHPPLIDEHNKQRQALLQLEKRWLTKNPWFRLVATIVGMSVVDMHRCSRHYDVMKRKKPQSEVDIIRILKFTDMICGNLRPWKCKQPRMEIPADRDGTKLLVRMTDDNGSTTTMPTKKQMEKGLTVGNPIVRPCFVCRRCIADKGGSREQNTSWRCRHCFMPLCNACRIGDDGGRELSCVEEHLQGDNEFFRCNGIHQKGKQVPVEQQVDLHPRRSSRGRR